MPWYDSDLFDGEVVSRMVELGVIEEGSPDEIGDQVDEGYIEGLITTGEARWVYDIKRYDGYTVTQRDWEFI